MNGDVMSLLFDYVKQLKMVNGSVVIPIHQGQACDPELAWVYRLGQRSSSHQYAGPVGNPRFVLPPDDLIDHIRSYVGDFGSLHVTVKNKAIVACYTTRHHMPLRS